MLKKTALVLLCLNLLTSKPAIAEPITITVAIVACIVSAAGGGFGGYLWGNSNGKAEVGAEKNKVEVENVKKDDEIKKLQAQLRRKIKQAEEDYQKTCPTRHTNLWSPGGSAVCAEMEKTIQSLQEQSRREQSLREEHIN